jgi:glycosyltransferase involved in cell wall biosynthesis
VALDEGGARETVIDGTTGVLVKEPGAEAFASGLSDVLRTSFDRDALRANALRFSRQQFFATFKAAVADALGSKAAR